MTPLIWGEAWLKGGKARWGIGVGVWGRKVRPREGKGRWVC